MTSLLIGACSDSQPSGGSNAETLARGETLYIANCQACHGDRDGIGRTPSAPPNNSQGHTWHHPDGQLLDIILDGTQMLSESRGLPPGIMYMPSFRERLTRDETLAIISHIKTWWTEEQRKHQAQVSRQWEEANRP